MKRSPRQSTFTERRIRSVEPGPKMRIEWDATVKGFGIRITSTGAVAYILNYRSQGYLRQVIIGRPGEMVLREERRQARVADGRMGARTVKGYELQARLSMLTENCSLFGIENLSLWFGAAVGKSPAAATARSLVAGGDLSTAGGPRRS